MPRKNMKYAPQIEEDKKWTFFTKRVAQEL